MRIKKLLFSVPILVFFAVLFGLFFFVPQLGANAISAPSLDISSFDRQYGDFVLDKAKWTFLASEDVFVSYGNVVEGKYLPLSNEDDGSFEYQCKLHLLVYDDSGDITPSMGDGKLKKPYDEEGNCILDPNPAGDNGGRAYRLYNGSFKVGAKDEPFARIYATEKGKNEGLSDFRLTTYSADVSIIVKKRQLKVGIAVDSIPQDLTPALNEVTIDSKKLLNLELYRTFSLETNLVLQDTDSNLVFNHTLGIFQTNQAENNGMYIYDTVGDYEPFTFSNANVQIFNANGDDVSDLYEIYSDYLVQIHVQKLKILAPSYDFESVYLQNCVDIKDVTLDEGGTIATIGKSSYGLTNFINSSKDERFQGSEDKIHYLDKDGNLLVNYNLSVNFSYSILAEKDCFTPALSEETDVYSLFVNQSIYNDRENYACLPILLSVDGYDKVEGFNHNDNFELVENANSSLKIIKRTIILYAEGAENEYPSLMPDPSSGIYCIPVSTKNFANPYGYAYNRLSSTTLSVDTVGDGEVDTEMEVTFRIKDFESYLNNANFHSLNDEVILNVGEYAIVFENITDWRYNATIHESLHYTVTPKEITLAELYESGSFVNQVDFDEEKYIISSYNFETEHQVYENVELKFSQKLPYRDANEGEYIEKNPIFSLSFSFAKQSVPGVYSSTAFIRDETSNYVLSDLTIDETTGEVKNIAIRIYNKLLSVSISDIEYDGTTPEIIITGKEEGLEYDMQKTYCTGGKYATNKIIKGEPTDAGTYTVRLKLTSSDIYAFEGGRDYIDVTFKIEKRKIIVTVTAKGDKTFGTKGYFNSPTDSNIATYKVEYNGEDKSKPALINGDKLGNLSSDACDISAKPATYKISTDSIKNNNYQITFKNSSGYEKEESIKVVQLTKEVAELKEFAKNNACVLNLDGHTVTLSYPKAFGVVMDKDSFSVSYSLDGDNFVADKVSKNKDSVVISGLSEGTNYTIRYTIAKKSVYLALAKDCVIDIKITTKLTIPNVAQNLEKTTDSEIFLNLYNYQQGEGVYFAIIEDDELFASGFEFDITEEFIRVEQIFDDEGNVQAEYAVLDIAKALSSAQGEDAEFLFKPEREYVIYLLIRKDTALQKKDQKPLTVITAPSKLDIKKSDIVISGNNISLNLTDVSEEDIFVIEYILGDSQKTITSIIDGDVDLSPVFQKEGAEILVNEGLSISDTLADRNYYLKIYKEKRSSVNGEEIAVKGEPIYFELHTPPAEPSVVETALSKISGYLGVGTMVVLLVALIIFTVIYSKLRRKWRIK